MKITVRIKSGTASPPIAIQAWPPPDIDGSMFFQSAAAFCESPCDQAPHDERDHQERYGHEPGKVRDALRRWPMRVEGGLLRGASREKHDERTGNQKTTHVLL